LSFCRYFKPKSGFSKAEFDWIRVKINWITGEIDWIKAKIE